MKKFILFAAALFGAAALVYGQQLPVLPNDPETKVGKLDNGLTYYIRHNDQPAKRAEFYLATKTDSHIFLSTCASTARRTSTERAF